MRAAGLYCKYPVAHVAEICGVAAARSINFGCAQPAEVTASAGSDCSIVCSFRDAEAENSGHKEDHYVVVAAAVRFGCGATTGGSGGPKRPVINGR